MPNLNPPDPHPSRGHLRLGAPPRNFQSSDMESTLSAPLNATTLGLMTKYWEVGRVKTRLGKGIGMARAAALHRVFVIHLCHTLGSFAGRRLICLAPDSTERQLSEDLARVQLGHLWDIVLQGDGNLGARMERWFQQAFGPQTNPTSVPQSASHAILIGADCPTIDLPTIRKAQDSLALHDVVIGPAVDGGYYLIGLSGPWVRERYHGLFNDIPWSTERVLEVTRERLSEARLTWSELEPQEDVDTVAELERLRDHLRASIGASLPGVEGTLLDKLRVELERTLSEELSSEHAGSKDDGGPQA